MCALEKATSDVLVSLSKNLDVDSDLVASVRMLPASTIPFPWEAIVTTQAVVCSRARMVVLHHTVFHKCRSPIFLQ